MFVLLQVRDEYIKWLTCTCGKDLTVVSLWKLKQSPGGIQPQKNWKDLCDTERNLFWQRDAPSVSEDLDKQTDDGKKGWRPVKRDKDEGNIHAHLFMFYFLYPSKWLVDNIHNLKRNLECIASECCWESALLLLVIKATFLHRSRL